MCNKTRERDRSYALTAPWRGTERKRSPQREGEKCVEGRLLSRSSLLLVDLTTNKSCFVERVLFWSRRRGKRERLVLRQRGTFWKLGRVLGPKQILDASIFRYCMSLKDRHEKVSALFCGRSMFYYPFSSLLCFK